MKIEHIALQPHPLETWRKALDALIACAPGNSQEVAAHLSNAMRQMFITGQLPRATGLQRRLVQRLVVASNLAIHIEEPEINEFGFSMVAPLIGEHRQPSPTHHTDTEACPETLAATPDQDIVAPATDVSAAPDSACLQSPLPQQGEAMHAPVHLPEPQGDRVSRSFRFLRW